MLGADVDGRGRGGVGSSRARSGEREGVPVQALQEKSHSWLLLHAISATRHGTSFSGKGTLSAAPDTPFCPTHRGQTA